MTKSNHDSDTRACSLRDLIAASLLASRACPPRCMITPSKGVVVSSLCDDSRRVRPGACFVAVRGATGDGHDHVNEAIRRGATAVVVEHDLPAQPHVARILVADSRQTLARLAATFYGAERITPTGSGETEISPAENGRGRGETPCAAPPQLVGVTGTNGKSTTAWFLRSILRTTGHACALMGTIEYDLVDRRIEAPLTTPGPIELCSHLAHATAQGARYAVLEVSSHALDQRRTDGLDFDAAIFTNLSGDHLDYHKTFDAYLQAKCRLFETLRPDAWALINLDDSASSTVREKARGQVRTYALNDPAADFIATILEADIHGTRFTIRGKDFGMPVRINLPGRYNVANALAAAAVADLLGVPRSTIKRGLESVSGVPGRLQAAAPRNHPFAVLVDYAHTDDALANALSTLAPLTCGRLICVFGCGGDRDQTKRARMAAVTERFCDEVWVTSDNPRQEPPHAIIDDVVAGFARPAQCALHVDVDRRKSIEGAIESARPGDTILIAGKGHETYQIVGDCVLDFDDLAVAKGCLAEVSDRAESLVPIGEVVA